MLKIIILLSILLTPSLATSSEPEWSGYQHLLQRYVHSGEKNNIALNLVDYQALKADKAWPALLSQLADFDTHQLSSKAEKTAFWINVYNILAIKVVLTHWPVQSIRDVGGIFSPVWKKDAGIIGGQMRSLHEVEHQILRQMGEPRIHFAIVCASVSCPDLKAVPYLAKKLDFQLNTQARSFLTQPDKGVSIQPGNIRISKIFDWFKDDFQPQGGVMPFISKYNKHIASQSKQASYLDYDWSLNAIPTEKDPG